MARGSRSTAAARAALAAARAAASAVPSSEPAAETVVNPLGRGSGGGYVCHGTGRDDF
jgi:hypothetical protein